jgi:CheY-like chemotaxis protein
VSRRVLVIDDETDLLEITTIALERLGGWTVRAVGDGAAGAQLAAEEQPDAVLLDVMMPGLDGEATARLLRAQPTTRHIPIVLLSAATDLPEWADELAVRGLVAKPFDPTELAGLVRAALGW